MVKRIIDGKTYNTETATKVAEEGYEYETAEDVFLWNQLFQTRYGAYFVYSGDERFEDYEVLCPMDPAEAQAWMEKYAYAELIEQHFGEMPEAGDLESRYTLRMPDSLKRGVDAAARVKEQSTNAWIVRCLELAIQRQMKETSND